MSTNATPNNDTQEIDLSSISKGIGNIFRGLNTFFYNCIRFVIRNIVLIGVLIVIGVGLGAYMDYTQKKVYDNQIIVKPNFESTDYLYSKIELINSKIKENDTVFLKAIGIKNPKSLVEIKVEPVIDIFKFVNNTTKEYNYKLLELMAQDGDMKKIMEEKATSKNYPYHTINFRTRGMTSREATVIPLLNYLNDNEFFAKVQKEIINNVQSKIKANDITISQIDGVLNEFSKTSEAGPKNDKLVYYNENTQLNDVIKTKDELIKEQGYNRVDLVSLDKIIKDNSVIINIHDKASIGGSMKFTLPLFLITIFLMVYFFKAFYRKQTLKHSIK